MCNVSLVSFAELSDSLIRGPDQVYPIKASSLRKVEILLICGIRVSLVAQLRLARSGTAAAVFRVGQFKSSNVLLAVSQAMKHCLSFFVCLSCFPFVFGLFVLFYFLCARTTFLIFAI